MNPSAYTKECEAVQHLLPKGHRFLRVGEKAPAGTKFFFGKTIMTNYLGATKILAIHAPHFVPVKSKPKAKTVSDKILAAFQSEIERLRALAKDAAKHECYELAAARSVRAQILDEALGIAMKAVKS